MLQTKSGLLEKRWGVGGEVKTERNGLSLSLPVLSVGTVPTMVTAECCHYALWGAFTQRLLLCVTVLMCVCVCVYLLSRVPLLTPIGTFNLCVCVCTACVGLDWRISVVIVNQKPTSHRSEALGEEFKWERTKERVEQIERDRARGRRRSTRWSEALSHQLALWPLSFSLSIPHFIFFCLSLSILHSFPLAVFVSS